MKPALILLSLCAKQAFSSSSSSWDYEHMSSWSDSYPMCSVSDQSPIDIPLSAVIDPNVCGATLDWDLDFTHNTFQIHNNGHSLSLKPMKEINSAADNELSDVFTDEGTQYMPLSLNENTIGTFPNYFAETEAHKMYCLDSLHFHWGTTDETGSEHLVGGYQYPLELHFVHYSCDHTSLGSTLAEFTTEAKVGEAMENGIDTHQLGVIGIFFDVVDDRMNPAFDIIFTNETLYEKDVSHGGHSSVVNGLDLSQLIPDHIKSEGYYAYKGSLTTPPCTNIVNWHLMNARGYIHKSQMEKFRLLFSAESEEIAPNYREVQTHNNNTVYSCIGVTEVDSVTETTHPANAAMSGIIAILVLAAVIGIFSCAKWKSDTHKTQSSESTQSNEERAEWEFTFVAVIFQILLFILYAISADYNDGSDALHFDDEEYGAEPWKFYSMFQDVHAMMFIGFGFLMTFLRKYGFGALSFNFILCAFGIQWGMYVFHMIPWLFGEGSGVFYISAYKLVDGDIAVAVVLISFGALLGRTNPAQLLVMCFFELLFWAINFYICVDLLGIVDVGGSIVVHTFGAYFGLAASYWIQVPKDTAERKSVYHSDMFSMVGTLFLWLYWPSFNGFFANREYYFMDRAFVNTVLSLCGSTVTTFIVSRLVRKESKFDMVHIQNATLAGGVAIGACADLYLTPAGAIAIGIIAGIVSVIGYEYLSDLIENKLGISDTCGIHNLHGMPGVLGGIISAIAIIGAKGKDYYVKPDEEGYPFGSHTLWQQSGYQIAGLIVTILMAIVTGSVTAFIIRWMTFPSKKSLFGDEGNFIVPSEDKDYMQGTIRKEHFNSTELTRSN